MCNRGMRPWRLRTMRSVTKTTCIALRATCRPTVAKMWRFPARSLPIARLHCLIARPGSCRWRPTCGRSPVFRPDPLFWRPSIRPRNELFSQRLTTRNSGSSLGSTADPARWPGPHSWEKFGLMAPPSSSSRPSRRAAWRCRLWLPAWPVRPLVLKPSKPRLRLRRCCRQWLASKSTLRITRCCRGGCRAPRISKSLACPAW